MRIDREEKVKEKEKYSSEEKEEKKLGFKKGVNI